MSFPVVLSPLRYESVPADRAAKIADFIGTIRPSIQNGQNGQANGQDFLNTLYIFSLSLPAELVDYP